MHSPHRTDPGSRATDLVERLRCSEIFCDFRKAFESTTHVPIGLRPATTPVEDLHDARWVNPVCALLASVNSGCATCLGLRQREQSIPGLRRERQGCPAGLCATSVPVRIGENVVAYLEMAQVLLHPPFSAEIKRALALVAERSASVDLRRAEQAYFRTPVIDRKHYQALVRLITIFAEYFSTVSNQLAVATSQEELPTIEKAKEFIAEHVNEDLSLVGVAHAVHSSPFYFCKMFRQATGLHFVDYLGRVRVERAKTLLLNPHCRISEAAFEAGFQSLSQFNRVFRRVAGEPPTRWRGKALRAR